LDIIHFLGLEDPQHLRGLIWVEWQEQGRYSCGLIRRSWSQSLGIVWVFKPKKMGSVHNFCHDNRILFMLISLRMVVP